MRLLVADEDEGDADKEAKRLASNAEARTAVKDTLTAARHAQ